MYKAYEFPRRTFGYPILCFTQCEWYPKNHAILFRVSQIYNPPKEETFVTITNEGAVHVGFIQVNLHFRVH
jgi:hypothetical protein